MRGIDKVYEYGVIMIIDIIIVKRFIVIIKRKFLKYSFWEECLYVIKICFLIDRIYIRLWLFLKVFLLCIC